MLDPGHPTGLRADQLSLAQEEGNVEIIKPCRAEAERFLKALDPKKFEGADTREITRPIRGEPHTFTGLSYILHFAAPNVYFHTTTAYDILRHNGVEIGKRDYLGALSMK